MSKQEAAVEVGAFLHRVTQDGVVVLPDEAADKTKGGILIPDVAKKRLQIGTVLAVGPGKMTDGVFVKPECKEGDRITYGRYAGEEIVLKHDGREVLLLRDHDVRIILAEGF